MRCDLIRRDGLGTLAGFQSLSGFLMRCDSEFRVFDVPLLHVSIPIGFSDAL